MYKSYARSFVYIITAAFLCSCKPSKVIFYSYKVDNYLIDTGKRMLRTGRLISCGDYLFEFKMKINIESQTEVSGSNYEIIGSSTSYDTIGVYLLSGRSRQFIEFDTFAVNAQIIKKGSIAEKETGQKLGDGKVIINYTPPFISQPRDTVINNITCYYTEVLGDKEHPNPDSVGTQFFLIKNKQLASLYKMFGIICMNNEYTIVGVCQYHKRMKDRFWEEPADLRPVTPAERKICESLIQKAGLPLPR